MGHHSNSVILEVSKTYALLDIISILLGKPSVKPLLQVNRHIATIGSNHEGNEIKAEMELAHSKRGDADKAKFYLATLLGGKGG